MTEDLTTYRDDLAIDQSRLEFEWQNQAQLYAKWAERHANALLERDRAKENLDVIRSRVDRKIRKNPSGFGLDQDDKKRVTEDAIKAVVFEQPEYQEASKELIEANHAVNVLAVAKDAFGHRKSALENMTRLYVYQYYYAEPKIPGEQRDAVRGITQQGIREGLGDNPRIRSRMRSEDDPN